MRVSRSDRLVPKARVIRKRVPHSHRDPGHELVSESVVQGQPGGALTVLTFWLSFHHSAAIILSDGHVFLVYVSVPPIR